jgi:hypothetical protein
VNNAQDDDFIQVSQEGQTIELKVVLEIRKSLILDGNGTTLTKAPSFGSNNSSQFLDIYDCGEALVRRLHFKNGEATEYGGAVWNATENLILESCVFSGNRVTGSNSQRSNGGAIFSSNTLTIRGCTFYGNSGYYGGAVYFAAEGKTLTMTGNLFYGNTAGYYPVVYNDDGSVSASPQS